VTCLPCREEMASLTPWRSHDLRHTNATWLEDGGVPSRRIAEDLRAAIGVVGLGQRASPMGITCWHMTPDRSAAFIDSGQGHSDSGLCGWS
jgi:hypothetical protein